MNSAERRYLRRLGYAVPKRPEVPGEPVENRASPPSGTLLKRALRFWVRLSLPRKIVTGVFGAAVSCFTAYKFVSVDIGVSDPGHPRDTTPLAIPIRITNNGHFTERHLSMSCKLQATRLDLSFGSPYVSKAASLAPGESATVICAPGFHTNGSGRLIGGNITGERLIMDVSFDHGFGPIQIRRHKIIELTGNRDPDGIEEFDLNPLFGGR